MRTRRSEGVNLVEPSVVGPDPEADRAVDERRPYEREDDPRFEPHPSHDRACDHGGRDHGEAHLEEEVPEHRRLRAVAPRRQVGRDVRHQKVLERVADEAVAAERAAANEERMAQMKKESEERMAQATADAAAAAEADVRRKA